MAPQPKQDGSTGWRLPIDPSKKAFHMADINDLGKVVTGALLHPEKVGNGAYLSLATELNSFNDILQAFKENGKDYTYTQVPPEVLSTFFEGASEITAMLKYFEKYTYMGPNSKRQIDLAKEIATKEFVPLKEWISQNN